MGLKSNDWSPFNKRENETQLHIGRKPCDDRGRNWRHLEANKHQGLMATTSSYVGDTKQTPPQSPATEGTNLSDTLISDF